MHRNVTPSGLYWRRRCIVGVPLAILALWTAATFGPPASYADGAGYEGESTSSTPAFSSPAASAAPSNTGPRDGPELEYNANVHCEDEGCIPIAVSLPFGVADGARVDEVVASPTAPAIGAHAPRRGVQCQCGALPQSSR